MFRLPRGLRGPPLPSAIAHHVGRGLFQLKFGRTSALCFPRAEHMKRGTRSESRASSGQGSPLIPIEWLHR